MGNSLASRSFYESKTDYAMVAFPVLLWVVAVIVANPLGNFPLDDDWSYSLTVRHLLETGQFRPLGWTSMSLIGQTVWGALFCLPFGFSFNALRVSTLTAGALGLAGLAMLLRQVGCDRRKTVLATALVGFNPIYFVLAATFMSDIVFASLCVFSILLFCRYLLRRHTASLLLAIFLALWAVSVRQLGLFLPLAMLLTLLTEIRKDKRAIVLSAAALFASWVLLDLLSIWLNAHHAMPAAYLGRTPLSSVLLAAIPPTLTALGLKLAQIWWYLRAAIEQLGWSLFPLLALKLPDIARAYLGRPLGKLILSSAGLCGVVWFALQFAAHHLFPFNTWTTIQSAGLGPIWLADARMGPDVASLPTPFWIFVTMLGIGGGILLLLDLALTAMEITSALRAKKTDATLSVRTFLLTAACVYVAPCVLFGFYDRYLLPTLFPLATLIVVGGARSDAMLRAARRSRPSRQRWLSLTRILAWIALILTAAYAVAGTHDYLSWNRARWLLIDTLLDRGVPVTRIDGGYEFNGLYLYDPALDIKKPQPKMWWVHDDQYVIQFNPRPGYRVIDSADAGGWLPPLRTRLLTLQRASAPRAQLPASSDGYNGPAKSRAAHP